jgi:hypothetical protein
VAEAWAGAGADTRICLFAAFKVVPDGSRSESASETAPAGMGTSKPSAVAGADLLPCPGRRIYDLTAYVLCAAPTSGPAGNRLRHRDVDPAPGRLSATITAAGAARR